MNKNKISRRRLLKSILPFAFLGSSQFPETYYNLKTSQEIEKYSVCKIFSSLKLPAKDVIYYTSLLKLAFHPSFSKQDLKERLERDETQSPLLIDLSGSTQQLSRTTEHNYINVVKIRFKLHSMEGEVVREFPTLSLQ